jgi:Domain of unknown function (DUF4386)
MATNAQPGTERWTLLLGGLAAIVGSLLGMVGNLVHPETPIGDPAGVAQAIATSDTWFPIHLAIVVGIILMFGGLVALAHAIRGSLAVALARFGLAAATAGVAVGLVLVILDGVAARQLAEEWAAATGADQALKLQLVATNETVNFALASLFNLLFAGVAFGLFGFAVAASENFPRWLGLLVVLGALESIGAGLVQAEAGSPLVATRILTIVGPTVITLWLFAMGIVLVRRAHVVEGRGQVPAAQAAPIGSHP